MARALWGLFILFAVPVFGADHSLNQRADHELGNLVQIYDGIHAAPELSHHEEQTSALLAKELRAAGYTVTDHLGKYADPGLRGYGVVAVMKNGGGPTVLVRADMDALPVEEKTGASYASHVKAPDDSDIIPDDVHLQLTIRTFKPEVRQHILDALVRIANGIAQAAGVPADRAPIVKVSESEKADPIYNDPALTSRVTASLRSALGDDKVIPLEPMMGSEDFGGYGLEGHQIPTVLFRLGAIDAARIAASKASGVPLPSLHSSLFLPTPEPTIRTGMIAMTSVVMDLMKK